jgi:hypothetical protein
MTDNQLNRLMMFKAVRDYLEQNAETVSKIRILPEVVSVLSGKIALIESTAHKRQTVSAGKTDVKYEAQEQLIVQLTSLGAALFALANRSGRLETRALADRREWAYRKMRDEELIRAAEVILSELQTYAPELEAYGITSETLDLFRKSISAFDRALTVRDSSVTARTLGRSDLAQLFSAVRDLLNDELDPIIEMFRGSDPQFYDGYKALRVTKALAVRYRKNGDPVPEQNEVPAETQATTPGGSV